ncbi:hypothetical protein C0584_06175 [Candidatus Parcubacteria bacterium]|nr:MAG: hypothetical protein C0584_06175 [Candidatus Parcubacteria bacterium]
MNYEDHSLLGDEKHFWYEARKILIGKLFSHVSEKGNTKSILDVGCGIGGELDIISSFGRTTAMDIDKQAVELAKEKGHRTILADLENIKLDSNYFDIVCAFDVLEHLKNDRKVMSEIFSSLKSKGIFLFTVPAHPSLFGHHDKSTGHERRYTKKEILNKLQESGFKSVELYYWNIIILSAVYAYRKSKNLFFKKAKIESDAKKRNKFINSLLYFILKTEALHLFRRKTTPGLSIYGIARKK